MKIECQNCKSDFEIYPSWASLRKCCSLKCKAQLMTGVLSKKKGQKYPHLQGKNSHLWKGNDVSVKRIHIWMKQTYGKANKCEGTNCDGVIKKFEWSLLKGKKYEKKRENFWMLCPRCHFKYDWTEERKRKHILRLLGSKLSKTTREKMSNSQYKRWQMIHTGQGKQL